jgi:AbrB family looped-hinge helix DNA binding protein
VKKVSYYGVCILFCEAGHTRNIVKVTKKDHITIPAALRKKFGIKEGDQLLAEATEKGILFRPIPKLEDMAGKYAEYGKPEEIKKEIDKLREEY